MMMMNKSLFLALIGTSMLSQTAMGQEENLTGSFSMDRFTESEPGELSGLVANFLADYTQEPPLIEEATIGRKEEVDPCTLPGSITVAEYCGQLENDSEPLYVWCKSLVDTNLIWRYADRNRKFTIFCPSNAAYISYYTEVARVPEVAFEKLVPILEYHDIEGTIYEPNKLWCKKKVGTTTTLIEGNVKVPKIMCQNDIAGGPVTFLRGSDKSSQKIYPPQFEAPAHPVRVCNANLYEMSNFVLYKEKSANGNKKKRRNNKNKQNQETGNLVVASTPAPTPAPTAPPSPITMLYGPPM